MDKEEYEILVRLDGALQQESARAVIESIAVRVERKLAEDREALLAWEPVPLTAYSGGLPAVIRSSWVFILRARTVTGAERHPNSHQRVKSYRGSGDLQIWIDGQWRSHNLAGSEDAPLEERWASIPANTWHQGVVPEANWVVVSFHTVPADELIEERPDPEDWQLTRRRKYLGGGE